MTAYLAGKAAATVPARAHVGATILYESYTFTANVANGDTVDMFKIAAGATVIAGGISATDLDTHGSPTLTISVGDAGSAARYLSASTIGQAGGSAAFNVAGGQNYNYTADGVLRLTFATPATGTTGTVKAWALVTFES